MSGSNMKEANTSGRFADTNYEYFWGCELTSEKPAVTWSFEEEEGDTDFLDHTLFLKHAVLGAKAETGERNLVQVETKNFDGDSLTQPLFSLTLGQNDCCFLDVSFGHRIPVTFRLIKGSGPVHISAQQLTEFPTDPNPDDSQDDLYLKGVNTEDEEEDSPLKQAKKRKAGAQKNAKSKKGKLDASLDEEDEDESMEEDDDDELDDEDDDEDLDEDEDEEEEDEDSPPKKGAKGKAKKEQKGKAAANGTKAKKPTKAAANGKAAAKKGKKVKA